METKFNFNSQICTNRQQSERLLSLGLKKETADMSIISKYLGCDDDGVLIYEENIYTYPPSNEKICPAWSLHRLMSLFPDSIYHKNKACFFYLHSSKFCEWRSEIWKWGAVDNVVEIFAKSDVWENLIDCIEWLIKEGYFNKEYLEG